MKHMDNIIYQVNERYYFFQNIPTKKLEMIPY